MYDFDDTSPSALLHAYLEGDLDPIEEPRLFSMLAENGELRSEMHDYLLIGNAVDQDSDRLAPGAHLRDNVWSSLGLGAPAAAVSAPAPFWNMRLVGIALLSAVVAVLMTLGTLLLLDDGAIIQRAPAERMAGAGSEPEKRISRERTSPAPVPAQPAPAAKERMMGMESSGRSTAQRAIAPRRNTLAVDDRAYGRSPAVIEPDPSLDAGAVDAISPRSIGGGAPIATYHEPAGAAPIDHARSDAMPGEEEDQERRFLVHVHGLTANSYPAVAIGQPSDPLFNNMSAGVGYALAKGSQLAIEVGQEPFTQRYSGLEGRRGVTYTQKPLLFWAGASYRLDLEGLNLGGVHPYAKVLAGGTSVGPLFKGTIGLNYLPDTRVGFSLGVEGSFLPYRFQGNWFGSRKLGVTYGLSLLF
jgi:hypothetical protein